MKIEEVSLKIKQIKENVNKVIIGKEKIIDLVLTAVLSNGHILLEDTPGTGKTTLAKAIAKSVDCNFNRIQFTPDLLPSDITGLNVFNQKESRFDFIEGPIFTNILLADEINRATPRTQSSLLEAMEEKQVTTDGVTRKLDNPFLVIATQNPIETLGTFPLPEAQLDRFMMKLSIGYPEAEEELNIINKFIAESPLESIQAVCTKEDIISMKKCVKGVFIHDSLKKYIINIVKATRESNNITLGVSPRGTLAFVNACQSYAAIQGREYIVPEDIKILSEYVLAHRIISFNNSAKENIETIKNIVEGISVPTEKWEA